MATKVISETVQSVRRQDLVQLRISKDVDGNPVLLAIYNIKTVDEDIFATKQMVLPLTAQQTTNLKNAIDDDWLPHINTAEGL